MSEKVIERNATIRYYQRSTLPIYQKLINHFRFLPEGHTRPESGIALTNEGRLIYPKSMLIWNTSEDFTIPKTDIPSLIVCIHSGAIKLPYIDAVKFMIETPGVMEVLHVSGADYTIWVSRSLEPRNIVQFKDKPDDTGELFLKSLNHSVSIAEIYEGVVFEEVYEDNRFKNPYHS